MKRKCFFLTMSVLTILLFFTSCLPAQEKPVISIINPENTVSAGQESITAPDNSNASNPTVTEGNTTGSTGLAETGTAVVTKPDLKKLFELENSFVIANAFPGITFKRPLEFQDAGDGSGRIFIAEQSGRIFVIPAPGAVKADLFLDISSRVDDSSNEKGLLGLAFHPDFKKNGQLFVNYTTGNNTVVSSFMVLNNNPNLADPGSEEILLTFKQPYANHNGGKIAFGPDDGCLYIAVGDGGGAGDPQGNGQNLKTLLGKILRIDVNRKDSGLGYSIPSDNPFNGNTEGFREEIYAYGLRNPWRFSFDSIAKQLWAADVGQDKTEEIDIIQKGKNYGWNIMEGSYCYNPASGCNPEGLQLPVYEYQHPLGESITGGYVYRGTKIPELQGVYVYADFTTGYIWGLVYMDNQEAKNFTLVKTGLNISSFGLDKDQELYFTAFNGKIYNLAIP